MTVYFRVCTNAIITMIVEVRRHVAGPQKGKLGAVPQVLGMEPHLLSVLTQVGEEFNQLTHGKDEKSLGKRIRGYKAGIFLSLVGLFIAIAKLLHNRIEPTDVPALNSMRAQEAKQEAIEKLWSKPELEKVTGEFNRNRWQVSTDHFYTITGKPLLSSEEIKKAAARGSLRAAVMNSPHYQPFVVLQKMTLSTMDIVKHRAESEERIFKNHKDIEVLLLDSLRAADYSEVQTLGAASDAWKNTNLDKKNISSMFYSSKFKNTLRIVLVVASGLLVYFLNQVKIKAQRIAHLQAKEFLKTVSQDRLSPFGVVAVTTPALDRLIFTHNNKKAAIEHQRMIKAYMAPPAPVLYHPAPMAYHQQQYQHTAEMVNLDTSEANLQYPHIPHPACRPSRPYYPVVPQPLAHHPHGLYPHQQQHPYAYAQQYNAHAHFA